MHLLETCQICIACIFKLLKTHFCLLQIFPSWSEVCLELISNSSTDLQFGFLCSPSESDGIWWSDPEARFEGALWKGLPGIRMSQSQVCGGGRSGRHIHTSSTVQSNKLNNPKKSNEMQCNGQTYDFRGHAYSTVHSYIHRIRYLIRVNQQELSYLNNLHTAFCMLWRFLHFSLKSKKRCTLSCSILHLAEMMFTVSSRPQTVCTARWWEKVGWPCHQFLWRRISCALLRQLAQQSQYHDEMRWEWCPAHNCHLFLSPATALPNLHILAATGFIIIINIKHGKNWLNWRIVFCVLSVTWQHNYGACFDLFG